MCAGEEEIGSPSLAAVVQEHKDWFKNAELIIISNSQWIGNDLPCLTYGMRGMICVTVKVFVSCGCFPGAHHSMVCGRECVTVKMSFSRGMLAFLQVEGGARDLHSGNDGGVFNEPMADLCKLLATLVDSQHNILVPGFYDDVADGLLEPTLAAWQVCLGISHSRSHHVTFSFSWCTCNDLMWHFRPCDVFLHVAYPSM